MKTHLANHGRSILRAVKRILPAPIILLLKRLYYQHLLPLSFRDLSSDERKLLKAYNVTTLPPADLRFRVHGTADVASFLAVGKTNYENICQAIALAGVKPNDVRTVLDLAAGPAGLCCGGSARQRRQHCMLPISMRRPSLGFVSI